MGAGGLPWTGLVPRLSDRLERSPPERQGKEVCLGHQFMPPTTHPDNLVHSAVPLRGAGSVAGQSRHPGGGSRGGAAINNLN